MKNNKCKNGGGKAKSKTKSKTKSKAQPQSPYSWSYDDRFEWFEKNKKTHPSTFSWYKETQLNKKHKYHDYFWNYEFDEYFGGKNLIPKEPSIKDMPMDMFLGSYIGKLDSYLIRHFDEIKDNCKKVNEMLGLFIEKEKNSQIFYKRGKNYHEANHMMFSLLLPLTRMNDSQLKKLLIWLHPDKCPDSDKYKQNIDLIKNARMAIKPIFKRRMSELDHNLIHDYGMTEIIPLLF